MNKPVIYQYSQGNIDYDISFATENKYQMINATEMAKPFNANIGDFLRDPKRFEMVYKLCVRKSLTISEMNIPTSLSISQLAIIFPESIKVIKGGVKKQGTWFHEDIGVEYARWLSVDFAIWCNDRIKELLKQGYVYLKTSEFNSLHEHTFAQNQRNNSRAIAVKNGGSEKDVNKIIKYFKEMFETYVGMTPRSLTVWAEKQGVPLSIVNAGGRETLRYLSPEQASAISFIDNAISSNPNLSMEDMYDLIKIGKRLEPEFKAMCNMGIGDYNDLKYLNKMNKLTALK